MVKQKEWFDTWFDTPYYHILYKNRDFDEASAFIDVLYHHLRLHPRLKVLDLACGKGRHSIHLNQLGLDVTGVDLSRSSITTAKQFENESLRFFQHDMREVFRENVFDVVLNLFTSFGYFADDEDNEKAIKAMADDLKQEGTLVLDFFNPKYVLDTLVKQEDKIIDNVEFSISKEVVKGHIIKSIKVKDNGEEYDFEERVKAITKEEFEKCFKLAGMKVEHIYGSYQLDDFDAEASERMIFIARK